MPRMRFMYIWQTPGWPGLTWDANAVTAPLAQARLAQGRMLGLAAGLGMADLGQLQLTSVRASAARRLGLADASAVARDARTEATLDVLQAAISRWEHPLTED